MAAGDKITHDGQAEIRGLLIGHGTPYPVESWDGLGLPAVRADDVDLEGRDGAASGADTYSPRQISAKIGVTAADRWELGERRRALAAAFARTDGVQTVPFVVRLAYWRRRFEVRPRKLDLPWTGVDSSMAMTVGGAFAILALDPYAYDVATTTVQATIADGTDTVDVEVDNEGDGRTYPVLTIAGPAEDPVIANPANGRTVTLDVTLLAGETLVYDVAANTMAVDGVAGWWATTGSDDLELVPGAQTLTFSRTDTAGAPTLDVTWRHAWSSAV